MTKKSYFLALIVLLSVYAFVTKSQVSHNYEERFDSSKITSLQFVVDSSDIKVKATDEKSSRVQVDKTSDCGEVQFSLIDGELKINSSRPLRGGCHVNYQAFVPAGTSISIIAGKSKVDVENMSGLNIKAGNLNLNARNTVAINLQYASGMAEIYHDKLPDYPYSNAINTASGSANFHLPAQSTVNIISSGLKSYKSDFSNCIKALFPIVFNSASGSLNVKNN